MDQRASDALSTEIQHRDDYLFCPLDVVDTGDLRLGRLRRDVLIPEMYEIGRQQRQFHVFRYRVGQRHSRTQSNHSDPRQARVIRVLEHNV